MTHTRVPSIANFQSIKLDARSFLAECCCPELKMQSLGLAHFNIQETVEQRANFFQKKLTSLFVDLLSAQECTSGSRLKDVIFNKHRHEVSVAGHILPAGRVVDDLQVDS